MAKGNGGTRTSRPSSASVGSDFPFKVVIGNGVDREYADRLFNYAKEILKEEGISVDKVIVSDKTYVDSSMSDKAVAVNRKGEIEFGKGIAGKEYEVVAHEIAHQIPVFPKSVVPTDKKIREHYEKFKKGIDNPKTPADFSRKAIYEKMKAKKAEYDRNKKQNDAMNSLYNELRRAGRGALISDYAYRGGVREFAAEAFAQYKEHQRAIRNGKKVPRWDSDDIRVRAYKIMKQYR